MDSNSVDETGRTPSGFATRGLFLYESKAANLIQHNAGGGNRVDVNYSGNPGANEPWEFEQGVYIANPSKNPPYAYQLERYPPSNTANEPGYGLGSRETNNTFSEHDSSDGEKIKAKSNTTNRFTDNYWRLRVWTDVYGGRPHTLSSGREFSPPVKRAPDSASVVRQAVNATQPGREAKLSGIERMYQ